MNALNVGDLARIYFILKMITSGYSAEYPK